MDVLNPSSPSMNDKQARILEAARKRVMHYGVSKTTMNDIADDTQMAVGTIYLYFKNKDEIVLAIAQECRNEQDQVLQGILRNPSLQADEKLVEFFVEKYRYIKAFRTETPHGKELIAYLVQNYPELLEVWEIRFEEAIISILQLGHEQGAIWLEDVQAAARLLRISTLGFFPPPYVDVPRYPKEEELVMLVRWFVSLWQEAV